MDAIFFNVFRQNEQHKVMNKNYCEICECSYMETKKRSNIYMYSNIEMDCQETGMCTIPSVSIRYH